MTAGTRQTRSTASNSVRDLGWTGFMISVDARASSSRWRVCPQAAQAQQEETTKQKKQRCINSKSVRGLRRDRYGLKGGPGLLLRGTISLPCVHTPSRL